MAGRGRPSKEDLKERKNSFYMDEIEAALDEHQQIGEDIEEEETEDLCSILHNRTLDDIPEYED